MRSFNFFRAFSRPLVGAAMFAALLVGCADNNPGGQDDDSGTTGPDASVDSGVPPDALIIVGDDASNECAGEVRTADLVPLDMYVILDRSGSMLDKTGTQGQGVVKWEAVTDALSAFMADPQTAGMGVGLQYFPIMKPDAPASCTSSSDCAASNSGPCVLGICSDNSAYCGDNSDCPGGGVTCDPLGECANQPGSLCLPIGANCPGQQGQCVQVTSSICLDTDACDASLYATPEVPIAALPGVATDIDTSIANQSPEGGTPTSAALQGGVDYASTFAAANPDHTVVVVLATDGQPTSCEPLDAQGIGAIAATGVAGDPSVLTFVIGIIESNDQGAQALLDEVALAGGTQQAYFVDPANSNVSDQFLLALEAIRGTALACEYFVPQPDSTLETIVYDQVNVEHTPEGATDPETIYYVGDASQCQADTGGWYYDVDPAEGTPNTIIMCPATCDVFSAGGTVNIRVGCQTIVL